MQQNSIRTRDFIVIGGGIAGASIAWELSASKRGVLLEREDAFGYHTTGRSVSTSVELLRDKTIFCLTRQSRDFLSNPPNGFAEVPLLRPSGCYITGTASEQAQLEEAWRDAVALGVEATLVSGADIARHVPVIRNHEDAVYAGIYEPNAQRIDVDGLLQGYLKALRARGSESHSGMEIEAITNTNNMWHVVTGQGTIQAPVLINAAGAWADHIAEMAGVNPVALQPKRRTIITFDAPAHLDVSSWPMIGDIGDNFYFLPEAGQLMGSAADATPSPPCDAQPEELDIARAAHNIQQYTQLEIDKINHKWSGLRTFAPDNLPVVGFDPDVAGFFWFAGQGGFGIQVAPALARVGATLVLGEKVQATADELQLDLNTILPNRLRQGHHVRPV